jgi:hypothetical protein
MSWVAVGIAGTSAGLSMMQGYQSNMAQGKLANAKRAAALKSYEAFKEASQMEVVMNNAAASAAQTEAIRAGAATMREAEVEEKQAVSKISAQSEGITAGASKAREVSTFYTQASKLKGKLNEGTRKNLIAIKETKDKANLKLAMDVRSAAVNAANSVATTQGPSNLFSTMLMSGLQGAAAGAQLGAAFNTLSSGSGTAGMSGTTNPTVNRSYSQGSTSGWSNSAIGG